MRLGRKLLTAAGVAATGFVSFKAAMLLINDDLAEFRYGAKKRFLLTSSGNNDSGGPVSALVGQKKKPKIVVLGSGWGALSFIYHLDKDKVDLTVISPRSFFFYTPLLVGVATGTVCYSSIIESIRWYCSGDEERGSRSNGSSNNISDNSSNSTLPYIQAECTDVDFNTKSVKCSISSGVEMSVDYDFLVIATGAETADFGIPGVKQHSQSIKEVEDGIQLHRTILEKLEVASSLLAARSTANAGGTATNAVVGSGDAGLQKTSYNGETDTDCEEVNRHLHWVVVGGGPSGVELTAELNDFVNEDVHRAFPSLAGRVRITLIEATDRILPSFDAKIAAYARETLQAQGARVACKTLVTKINADSVEILDKNETALTGGGGGGGGISGSGVPSTVPFGILVWAGGIAPRALTKHICAKIGPQKQTCPRRGILVDKMLRVEGLNSDSISISSDDHSNNSNTQITPAPASSTAAVATIIASASSTATATASSTPLAVDRSVRDTVFALGDCAVSGLPPTAQVAYQQGKYLGRLFREHDYAQQTWAVAAAGAQRGGSEEEQQSQQSGANLSTRTERTPPFTYEPFVYRDQGSMAYVGGSRAVAQLKPILWDKLDRKTSKSNNSNSNTSNSSDYDLVQGESAFAVWRSLYFSKLMSSRNRFQVICDWCRTAVYGRDISSPFVLQQQSMPEKAKQQQQQQQQQQGTGK